MLRASHSCKEQGYIPLEFTLPFFLRNYHPIHSISWWNWFQQPTTVISFYDSLGTPPAGLPHPCLSPLGNQSTVSKPHKGLLCFTTVLMAWWDPLGGRNRFVVYIQPCAIDVSWIPHASHMTTYPSGHGTFQNPDLGNDTSVAMRMLPT